MLPDKVRRSLTIAHRWLALALAPIFLLILLSGAILAFKPIVQGKSDTAAIDAPTLLAVLNAVDPQGSAAMLNVAPDGKTVELQARGPGVNGRFDTVTHAPATGGSNFDLFTFALDLHKHLLVGAGVVVEIATYIMVAILVLGLLLGLPKLRNTLIGWHSGLGWLALPLVALPPVTGLLMLLHIGTPTLPVIEPAAQPLPLARAIEAASTQADPTGFITARRFRQGSVLLTAMTAAGPMRYLVSGTGKVVPLTEGPGLIRQLHEGTWAGVWSGLLSFLSALALMGLMATGLYSWLRRQRQAQRCSGDRNASILVAFASQTGTAARLAEATARALRDAGEAVVCVSLTALVPRDMVTFRSSFLIVSTTGNGEVPDPARPFLARLDLSDLQGARFSLLALGDSRYPSFCGGGRKIRDALLEHGAREINTWQCADGEPTSTWRQWLEDAARTLGRSLGAVEAPEPDYPLTLTLVERERLDDPIHGDTRETWRLAFEPVGGALEFRPGDLLLISPAESEAPRCYSIGASSLAGDTCIGLTISLHAWEDAAGNHRLGLASGYLCRLLPRGAQIRAKLRRHPGFNPPHDPARPLILVAAGAGIAPFPGFLAERAQQANAGPVWLLFGNRRRTGDFFYRTAFEHWLSTGVLTRLDTAFSRDADDGCHIQDRLIEHGEDILHWLVKRQAILYTCGRATTVGISIERALLTILVRYGNRYGLRPDATLARWRADGTLRMDIFG